MPNRHVPSNGPRRGNKGIAAAKKAHKREEAEERNSRTPLERTRAYRRRLVREEDA